MLTSYCVSGSSITSLVAVTVPLAVTVPTNETGRTCNTENLLIGRAGSHVRIGPARNGLGVCMGVQCMKYAFVCLVTGLTLGFSLSAIAQPGAAPGDTKYCSALAKAYSGTFPTQEAMPASDVVMMSQCDSNAQAAIPVLEKKLADKKIPLPADERVAHQPGTTGMQH